MQKSAVVHNQISQQLKTVQQPLNDLKKQWRELIKNHDTISDQQDQQLLEQLNKLEQAISGFKKTPYQAVGATGSLVHTLLANLSKLNPVAIKAKSTKRAIKITTTLIEKTTNTEHLFLPDNFAVNCFQRAAQVGDLDLLNALIEKLNNVKKTARDDILGYPGYKNVLDNIATIKTNKPLTVFKPLNPEQYHLVFHPRSIKHFFFPEKRLLPPLYIALANNHLQCAKAIQEKTQSNHDLVVQFNFHYYSKPDSDPVEASTTMTITPQRFIECNVDPSKQASTSHESFNTNTGQWPAFKK